MPLSVLEIVSSEESVADSAITEYLHTHHNTRELQQPHKIHTHIINLLRINKYYSTLTETSYISIHVLHQRL